jgi:hypothetical protein
MSQHARWAKIGLVTLAVGILSLIPLFAAVFPRFGLTRDAAPSTVLPTVAQNPWLFIGPGSVQLFTHTMGAVGIIALTFLWNPRSLLLVCATFGGLLWMGADIIDNALTMVLVPRLARAFVAGDADATRVLPLIHSLTEAIRFGAHFAGGLWVLGVSAYAWRTATTGRLLAGTGFAIGAIFAANVFAPPLMFATMLTLPAWLIALGVRARPE